MNAILTQAKLEGEILAIPSKTFAHRAIICNYLSGNNGSLSGLYNSIDINATLGCINTLLLDKEKVLDCKESGTTLRLLLPVVSALGGRYDFIGQGRLMQRPNAELERVLSEHGIKVEKGDGISVCGKLNCGDFYIRGDVSSQYISGLLMALPILDGDSRIILTTPLQSAPYVDVTLSILKLYGIEIIKIDNGFFIKGNQAYKKVDYVIEGDWSNASCFLVAGAMFGKITVKNLNLNSLQGDKAILKVIESAGGKITFGDNSVTVEKGELKPFTYSLKDCPDLVSAMALLGVASNGVSVIKDVNRLKIKESNRVESIIKMLSSFGIKAEENDDSICIYGGKVKGGKVDSFNDHRIVMASSILSCLGNEKTIITNAQAVDKSYPTFFEDLIMLGGKVKLYEK